MGGVSAASVAVGRRVYGTLNTGRASLSALADRLAIGTASCL